MYRALYRKWRPQTFDDVVGQGHITESLKNQMRTGRLSHAYLFIGSRGTGKTTCAKILAKAVNCENPQNGNPCCKCPTCLGIDSGAIADVVEMDAASNNGVSDVRALRDEAVFTPGVCKKRVYIIDEVHMLSTSAFNALLKIIEEPPEHLIFILATTELNKIPATILSRCQRHSFKRLDRELIAGRLKYVAENEGIALKDDAARVISSICEGGMRDALSILDQCSSIGGDIDADAVYSAIGIAGNIDTERLFDKIILGDTDGALGIFHELWCGGKDHSSTLSELATLLRETLVLSVAPKNGADMISGAHPAERLRGFAGKVPHALLIEHIKTASSALQDAKIMHAKTAAELCIVTLCKSKSITNGILIPADFEDRLRRLESGIVINGAGSFTPSKEPPSISEDVLSLAAEIAKSHEEGAKSPGAIKPAALTDEKTEEAKEDDIITPPWEDPNEGDDRPPFDPDMMDIPPVGNEEQYPKPLPTEEKEKEPEKAPSPLPSPAAPATPAEGGSDNERIRKLKETVKKELPGSRASILDSPMAQFYVSGNTVFLATENQFAYTQLSKTCDTGIYTKAVAELWGDGYAFRILAAGEPVPALIKAEKEVSPEEKKVSADRLSSLLEGFKQGGYDTSITIS
ncbi:MAG: DNA polymerase III subunit gamma/tau [Oscillospiraceae bacterium]|nr:DNA polymerase III subunit gamma/tau [Oscillospiraceae bacterium]